MLGSIQVTAVEEEDEKHILLECKETRRWREEWLKRNWPGMNEILVYKKITSYTDVKKTKLFLNYLFKVKCKWEYKVKGDASSAPLTDF
jgi:hypothetical protein